MVLVMGSYMRAMLRDTEVCLSRLKIEGVGSFLQEWSSNGFIPVLGIENTAASTYWVPLGKSIGYVIASCAKA